MTRGWNLGDRNFNNFKTQIYFKSKLRACPRTVVYREIETAVPDERILVLFVPNILLTRSYNIKVNIFGLNEVKIEIESPGAALCTCLVPNLYSLRYPK